MRRINAHYVHVVYHYCIMAMCYMTESLQGFFCSIIRLKIENYDTILLFNGLLYTRFCKQFFTRVLSFVYKLGFASFTNITQHSREKQFAKSRVNRSPLNNK